MGSMFVAQSALLLQDAGLLYMTLKAASGGAAFAQFVCQRVLPSLGLRDNEIEGIASLHVAERDIAPRLKFFCSISACFAG